MKKGTTLKSINRSYHSHMKSLTSKGREKDILTALSNGKNTYMRMDRLESSSFDSSWIEVIEDVIFDLGTIIANPKMTNKVEGNIVPVELARKVNAETVQHLASHTQYVKEIDEYGNVIPSKLLTMMYDDDIKTYENRFIATFVRRLVLFIEKRYEFVSKFAELHDEQVLMFKNRSIVDGAEVEIETKIRINHKSDDELSLKSNAYVERIKQMREYILYFYTSAFMKQLKTEKDVHNPIIQTNIIRKNPLYHHCYEVYRFIERYEHLGVSYKVDEHYSLFEDSELEELNRTLFANYITLKGKDRSANAKSNSKVYKPKILTSRDDEQFVYGSYFEGPIEFVRVDEPYQKYLDSKVRKDLPLHPTKREKEYYAPEYEDKKENREDLKQKNDLLKRKDKEIKAFNKAAAKIDQEREEARRRLLEKEQTIIKQEENDMLTAARNEIIAASMKDHEKNIKVTKNKDFETPKVVPMSHPYSDPVTYDEAVLDIWPQTANAPLLRMEPKVEQPKVEKPKAKEKAPAKVVKVLSFDEAANEIWPQLANAQKAVSKKPAKKAKVVSKPAPQRVEEKPVATAPVEEKKEQPKVVPMSHPHTDPVSYDEATLEIWPQIANAPTLREAPEEEEAVIVIPSKEEAPIKEEKKPAKKIIKKAAKVVEQPVEEEQEEVKPVSKPKEEPKKETKKAPKVEKAKEEKKPEPDKEKEVSPKAKEKAKVKPQVKVIKKAAKEPIPVPVVEEKPREKIPGRFIVKTTDGYYVSKNKYSIYKDDAKIFDDYNLAKDVKKEKGGKVVKL